MTPKDLPPTNSALTYPRPVGVTFAPGRAREIESACLQLFTKQPNRWAEPVVNQEMASGFREEMEAHGDPGGWVSRLLPHQSGDAQPGALGAVIPILQERAGPVRGAGTRFPGDPSGNATDGDQKSGIERNAEGVTRALEEVAGPTRVLLEITAGSGTTVGASFQDLASISGKIPAGLQSRLGICFDTCHAYSAGYDLVNDYEGVWSAFGDILGLDRLGLFHMNDSKNPFASRKDRHEHLGEGSLGVEPFRRIVQDPRFFGIPKILETPKEPEPVDNDVKNLRLLRSFRS